MNRADALGELRIVVSDAPLFASSVTCLDLHCHTCGTRLSAIETLRLDRLDESARFEVAEGNRLVLPFDPLAFGEHLLHEIRPLWNRRWVGHEAVRVVPRSALQMLALDARTP